MTNPNTPHPNPENQATQTNPNPTSDVNTDPNAPGMGSDTIATSTFPAGKAPQTDESQVTPGAQPESHHQPPTDSVPDLQEMVRIAERKAAEHYDAWLRAKAETENVRRRAEEEIAKARLYAIDKFAAALLPVKDSLEAALATENQTVESLREGVELTLKQLTAALEQFGIKEENPAGNKFDPNLHQAIGMIETDGEPNHVAQVLQKGYLIHERVLRPALVMVSKAKSGS
ncbi:molecular chaperone GrpE [Hydrogenophilus thermoluteolus]|uniref:Protein GrpE n=2 Tax=Hydrogenophilus thermoluteolus TaxID=297 RepID=A0A2Z6DYA2_HYDTE|nr:nucleotide exchange factor GrpE [Hydrogenophilus thermoluteolus]BBD77467.1 molecular chaperone GrpE [Hydrogenophilus thermoluteolus]